MKQNILEVQELIKDIKSNRKSIVTAAGLSIYQHAKNVGVNMLVRVKLFSRNGIPTTRGK
jgi:hypothetical protein